VTVLKQILENFRKIAFVPSQLIRSQAVETTEAESHALEQLFTLLTAGALVGVPAPPLPITFELLPFMEEDLVSLMNSIDTAEQPLSYLFSVLNVN
jgi:hypothetical protein